MLLYRIVILDGVEMLLADPGTENLTFRMVGPGAETPR